MGDTHNIDDYGLFALQKLDEPKDGLYDKVDAGDHAVVIHTPSTLVAATRLGKFIDQLMRFEPGSETFFFDDPGDYDASFVGFIGEPFEDESYGHINAEIEPLSEFTSAVDGVEQLERIVFGKPCPACGNAHKDFRNTIVFEGCSHRHCDIRVASAEFYHAECRGWIADQLDQVYDRHADELLPEFLPD